MKTKITALVAMVGGIAYGGAVSRENAMSAAKRFAADGYVLGARIGTRAAWAKEHTVTNGVSFFAVKMEGGGTVFTSGNDESEPIVAWTSSTNDFSEIDHNSPMWALLKRDAEVRAAMRKHAIGAKAAKAKWGKYEGVYSDADNRISSVSDVRVAPLVATKWNQQSAGGHNCYNYYTPNGYPCGCTATATAQLMRYHKYPRTKVTALRKRCIVDGYYKWLTMKGGTYDWDSMVESPTSSNYTDARWEAIGRLTYDIGVAFVTDYTSSGSGSSFDDAANRLKDTFKYANAIRYGDSTLYNEMKSNGGVVTEEIGLHAAANREDVIYTNLDAGLPVLFGIYGYSPGQVGTGTIGGHAVVGDGYGYVASAGETNAYVHINMGWGGTYDAWYNLPQATTGYMDFTVFGECMYNISTNKTGEIVSGRVLDAGGNPIEGAIVTESAGGTQMTTGEKGTFAFMVASYSTVTLTATNTVGAEVGTRTVTLGKSSYPFSIGNKWGMDITPTSSEEEEEEHGRIIPTTLYVATNGVDVAGRGGEKNPFLSIGYAITNCIDGDVIEVGPGTYYEQVTAPAGKTIRIVSAEGPDNTTIDMQGNGNVYVGMDSAESSIEGFTLQNGYGYNGGGVLYGVVSNCVIVNCAAIYDARYHSEGVGGGGGVYGAVVYDSIIYGNWSDWYGGGAAYSDLYRCILSWNESQYGGGIANCVAENDLLVHNRVYGGDCEAYGGGAFNSEMANCTVAYNSATGAVSGAGGAYGGTANNCIITDNWLEGTTADGTNVTDGTGTYLSTMIGDDAGFTDAANGDFSLSARSKCVDAGDNSYVESECDLYGEKRIIGRKVDLGALERVVAQEGWNIPEITDNDTAESEADKVAAAMEAEGFPTNVTAAVTNVQQYSAIAEWANVNQVDKADLAKADTAILSPALGGDGILELEAEDVMLEIDSIADGEVKLVLPLDAYDKATVNESLLKAAIGIEGSATVDGKFSADSLDLKVQAGEENIEITVTPPKGDAYFMRAKVR